MTGVDVEHTKAEWIENRAGDLMDNSGCTLETAYEDAAEHWGEYVDTEWLPALVAAVERVQALHKPICEHSGAGCKSQICPMLVCRSCGDDYPCDTRKALEIK